MNVAASPQFDPRCERCPRLAAFLADCRQQRPDYHGRPVAAFGDPSPRLLIVGLAPGMHGANRTGRPFTGDHAGILLYETLHDLGAASAAVSVSTADGLRLPGVRITNAVKCVPPQNKPLPDEIRQCATFLNAEMRSLGGVRAVLALGRIAHDAVLAAHGQRRATFAFAHGAEHPLSANRWLVDSYHCSRYNTQTRRLTREMFRAALSRALALAA